MCFTDMREASRRLSQSLYDAYEADWAGEEDLGAIVEVRMIISGAIKSRAAADLPLNNAVAHKQQDSHIAGGAKIHSLFLHFIHN